MAIVGFCGLFGDPELKAQANAFLGLFQYNNGCFQEAIEPLQLALKSAEQEPIDYLLPVWLGYSLCYLGRQQEAIELLNSYWRRAWYESEWALSDNFRAALGIMMLYSRSGDREAFNHLQEVLQSAIAHNNPLAEYHSLLGLALYHYLGERIDRSYEIMLQAIKRAFTQGITLRQYTWPWFLEMVFAFHRKGWEPSPHFNFSSELIQKTAGANVHLKGVALRFRAMDNLDKDEDFRSVWKDLLESEKALDESRSFMELGKTRVEMARFQLKAGNRSQALIYADKARENLSLFSAALFPEDLKLLLSIDGQLIGLDQDHKNKAVFVRLMMQVAPSNDQDEYLGRLLSAVSRFFESANIGLYKLRLIKGSPEYFLVAGRNVLAGEASKFELKAKREFIMQATKSKRCMVNQWPQTFHADRAENERAAIVLPLKDHDQVQHLIYMSHSDPRIFLHGLTDSLLEFVSEQVSSHIERINKYCGLVEEKFFWVQKYDEGSEDSHDWAIRFRSNIMKETLEIADLASDSDASVLITGETGVGKGLLARRLHRMNRRRRQGPFVLVDIISIPENLLESELFGHEKGAFTGADEAKPGRMELAQGGTLFIDEVGDIPWTIQVKLLQAVQERTFFRVGGTKPVSADFRLAAATNRDLLKEVSDGRFRKDLYYRLNVVPIHVPPLRERPEDIVLLARHFLNLYCRKYNMAGLALTPEQEMTLSRYSWFGNVRELTNVIERAVILSPRKGLVFNLENDHSARMKLENHLVDDNPTLEELERRYIRMTLRKSKGKISGANGAAEILGIKRTTLLSRMRKLGISRFEKASHEIL
jgi:transcriptional regulator with GAF, ATPase, and Fis domain